MLDSEQRKAALGEDKRYLEIHKSRHRIDEFNSELLTFIVIEPIVDTGEMRRETESLEHEY